MNLNRFASALLPFLLAANGATAETPRPNIILIVADGQGYNELGCAGNPAIQTPILDQMAREGVRATDFYAAWPAATPARGSILTGRYPQRNGLYDLIRNPATDYGFQFTVEDRTDDHIENSGYGSSAEMTIGLDLREVLVAQPLGLGGYATAAVGEWDSGRARRYLPLQRGFDFFYGFANTGIDYWTHERYGIPSLFRGNGLIREEGYATDLFRREAVSFVRENRQRPFFLYLAFNAPAVSANYKGDPLPVPEAFLKQYPSRDASDPHTRRMAMITCMDAAVGEVLAVVKELGLDQNTLVIFTSANGGSLAGKGAVEDRPENNRPLRGHEGQVFEGGLRVPLIARWPGHLPAGTVTGEFLSSLEFYPTFLALGGLPQPKGAVLDGFDMLPVLRGKTASPRREMFWLHLQDEAARLGDYKWVSHHDPKIGGGLFDLRTDLGESHDLSTDQPDVLAQILDRYRAWKAEMDATEPHGPFRDY